MAVSSEIAERVFAPGNLVYGGSLRDLSSFVEQGIKPSGVFRNKRPLSTPNNLCFALLSTKELPRRYTSGCHYAPGGKFGGDSLGIVVSRQGLLDAFPNQVYAIGNYFWQRDCGDKREYNYDSKNKTVFGIPVKVPETDLVFADEVRVYPNDVQAAAVGPELWTGIVIEEFRLPHLRKYVKSLEFIDGIPIFSKNCKLLAPTLKEAIQARK